MKNNAQQNISPIRKSLADFLKQSIDFDAVVENKVATEIFITGLSDDSRVVQAGDLFLAVAGATVDAREYIDDAIENGALAVLVDKSERWNESEFYRGIPVLVVEKLNTKLAAIAANFYENPSQHVSIVGITGTNAKTSCASYLQQLLSMLDKSCGVIGTLGWGLGDNLITTGNTTPSNLLLQKILFEFKKQKTQFVGVEVSSHGLELGRVENVLFEAALFTNLSQDHLDFHGDMQSYAKAKMKLFKTPGLKLAIINRDDDYAEQFMAATSSAAKIISYGFSPQSDLRITNFQSDLMTLQAQLVYQNKVYQLNSSLLGDFNIYNLSAVVALLIGLGFELQKILDCVPAVKAVKGRMERVELKEVETQTNSEDMQSAATENLIAVIDYAHTPDGLEKVLSTLHKHKEQNSLWCVFGCGGDRDTSKRALMGSVVANYADRIVVTSDNPRTESAQKIIDDIALVSDGEKIIEEIDREKAIHYAIHHAAQGDCVLVAGKGHENYQEINHKKYPFSDHLVVRQALEQRAGYAS